MGLTATDLPLLWYAVIALTTLLFLHSFFVAHKLRHIPTVGGPSVPLLSFVGAFKYIFYTQILLQEGYEKYKGRVFKIALLDRWLIVVTGPTLVDELQRAPDDVVSFMQGSGELIGMDYIFGPEVMEDSYNIAVIRERLTRNLGPLYSDMYDEITDAFERLIPAREDGWLAVPALKTMREIVARTSSRIFIGLPLCRNSGYLDLSIELAEHAAKAEAFISFFPPLLKPLAGRISADFESRVNKARLYVDPIIQDRLKNMNSSLEEKPNDMLQWLIEGATARGKSMDSVVRFLLSTNFVAIDTSSSTFTHAVYHLAANPEYAQPLREEVERIITEEGWSKNAISRMHRVDSFLRESLRYNGIESIVLMRKMLRDFDFSDGTRVPAGMIVVTPIHATHHDEEFLDDARVFNPWRFVDMQGESKSTSSGATTKWQLANPSNTYLAFGLGKHACPGRFFAANELKTMLAHLVLHYDVKLENEGVRPPNFEIALAVVPNLSANVLFRRRKVQQ